MTITEFLLARIAEDEAVAREALAEPWAAGSWTPEVYDDGIRNRAVAFAPERVLAECETKRRIIELHDHVEQTYTDTPGVEFGCTICHIGAHGEDFNGGWCDTVRALALPYADHPDYDEAWRP